MYNLQILNPVGVRVIHPFADDTSSCLIYSSLLVLSGTLVLLMDGLSAEPVMLPSIAFGGAGHWIFFLGVQALRGSGPLTIYQLEGVWCPVFGVALLEGGFHYVATLGSL